MEASELPTDWELKVLEFEHRLRQLNNRRVEAVFYWEIDYHSESPAWSYRPELDSLDFGLVFELDNGDQFTVRWGDLFTQYCLSLGPSQWGDSKVWNVSQTSRWRDLLNVEVVATQLFWRETGCQDPDDHSHYPQDIGITFANGRQVYISALEILEKNIDCHRADHVTVFFDQSTARNYGVGPWSL